MVNLEKELTENPTLGTPLGHNAYKIRLNITSKRKGKSGGARIISLVETTITGIIEFTTNDDVIVSLISIYDKADVDSISEKELKDIIKKAYQK